MKKNISISSLAVVAVLVAGSPAMAQDSSRSGASEEGSENGGRGNSRVNVDPYIEVSQVAIAELSPGDDIVTYTQLAAGVDASITGRNNGGSVSLRVEQSIGYGDTAQNSTTVSGVARGYASIVPRALTVEAGGLVANTRVDGNGASTLNPLISEEAESTTYSAYAGPTLSTKAGDVHVNANYRIGYTRVESPDAIVTAPGATPLDVFDDSVSQSAKVHLATRPGEPLPIGVGVGAGWTQEDVSNLDQRVRDMYVRGDVQVPLSPSLALVAGVGYEDVEVSARDAVLDINGDPLLGADGRLVTDKSQPRQLAYDISGLIWDAGVIWRPSSRTSLQANVGRRYDSTTYYGNFAYAPSARESLNLSVYDSVNGFGSQLNNALANLPTEFNATRNALTGDLGGCVAGPDGSNCLGGVLGSVRSSVFRSRGIAGSYTVKAGRLSAGLGVGYDRRRFIAAQGTVLGAADGVTDQSYYASFFLSGELDAQSSFTTNLYANRFESGFDLAGDATTVGGSAAYNRSITRNLSARAAVAVDHVNTDVSAEDFTAASALVGLRLGF